jgi:hypothetical protein
MTETKLSFLNQLTAGAVAGITEISVMYPLDGNFQIIQSRENQEPISYWKK